MLSLSGDHYGADIITLFKYGDKLDQRLLDVSSEGVPVVGIVEFDHCYPVIDLNRKSVIFRQCFHHVLSFLLPSGNTDTVTISGLLLSLRPKELFPRPRLINIAAPFFLCMPCVSEGNIP